MAHLQRVRACVRARAPRTGAVLRWHGQLSARTPSACPQLRAAAAWGVGASHAPPRVLKGSTRWAHGLAVPAGGDGGVSATCEGHVPHATAHTRHVASTHASQCTQRTHRPVRWAHALRMVTGDCHSSGARHMSTSALERTSDGVASVPEGEAAAGTATAAPDSAGNDAPGSAADVFNPHRRSIAETSVAGRVLVSSLTRRLRMARRRAAAVAQAHERGAGHEGPGPDAGTYQGVEQALSGLRDIMCVLVTALAWRWRCMVRLVCCAACSS